MKRREMEKYMNFLLLLYEGKRFLFTGRNSLNGKRTCQGMGNSCILGKEFIITDWIKEMRA